MTFDEWLQAHGTGTAGELWDRTKAGDHAPRRCPHCGPLLALEGGAGGRDAAGLRQDLAWALEALAIAERRAPAPKRPAKAVVAALVGAVGRGVTVTETTLHDDGVGRRETVGVLVTKPEWLGWTARELANPWITA